MAGSRWRAVTTWLGRRPAVLPLLILACGLVALAAGPSPAEGAWTGVPDGELIQNVIIGVILALSAIGLVLLLLARGGPRDQGEPKKRSWLPSILALAVVFLFSLSDFQGELAPEEAQEPPPAEVTEAPGSDVAPGEGFEPGDGAAILLVMALALAVLWWSSRGLRAALAEVDDHHDADDAVLGAAVARAHGHLLDAEDPRDAVLLAYRDLERALESLDLPRHAAETPTEHLDRALAARSITDDDQAKPLRALAALYARARFSDHPVTEDDRDRAADALGRARRRLVPGP